VGVEVAEVVVEVVTVAAAEMVGVEVVGVEVRAAKERVGAGGGQVRLVARLVVQCQRKRLTLMMKRDRCGMWVSRLLRQRSPKRNGLQTGAAGDWKSGEGSTVAGAAARGGTGGPKQCGSAKEKRAAKENNKSKPEAVHVRLLGLRVR
jgi:hypothetical protein